MMAETSPALAWRWIPIVWPWAHVSKLIGELVGETLARESGIVGKFAGWPERVVSPSPPRRSTSAVFRSTTITLTLRDDFYEQSERGEAPIEIGTPRARVVFAAEGEHGECTLYLEDRRYYTFAGAPERVAMLEAAWLALLKREYMQHAWVEHPLVPAEWREPARSATLGPTYNRLVPGGLGGTRYLPAVVVASDPKTHAKTGLLLDQARMLPLGPLPRELGVRFLSATRAKGDALRSITETISRVVELDMPLVEIFRESKSSQAPNGFLSLLGGAPQITIHTAHRKGPWLYRATLSRPDRSPPSTLEGDFTEELALQEDAGDPYALFGLRIQTLRGTEEKLDVRVVGGDAPRDAATARLAQLLTNSGWLVKEATAFEPGEGWTT